MRNRNSWPNSVAIAHPNISKSSDARGRLTKAAPAKPVAAIGAIKTTARAISMTAPILGMRLMPIDERRIIRNRSQSAAQIARQEIDATLNDALAISAMPKMRLAMPPSGGNSR
jgi:hypothetical protein